MLYFVGSGLFRFGFGHMSFIYRGVLKCLCWIQRRMVTGLIALLLVGCVAEKNSVVVDALSERQIWVQPSETPVNTAGIYLVLIDRMQSQGLYDASLAHLDVFERRYGVLPQTTLLRADAMRVTERPDEAAALYARLLTTALAAQGHRGLGLIAGAAADFTRATREFELAVQLAPTDASTLSDLGYARVRTGDLSGARLPLLEAAELAQSDPRIECNVVLYLFAEGKPTLARELADELKLGSQTRGIILADVTRVPPVVSEDMGDSLPVAAVQKTSPFTNENMRSNETAATGASQRENPLPIILQRFLR